MHLILINLSKNTLRYAKNTASQFVKSLKWFFIWNQIIVTITLFLYVCSFIQAYFVDTHECRTHNWYHFHYIVEISCFLIPFVVIGIKMVECHKFTRQLKTNLITKYCGSDERKEVILFIQDQMKSNSPFRIYILWKRVDPTIPALSVVVIGSVLPIDSVFGLTVFIGFC